MQLIQNSDLQHISGGATQTRYAPSSLAVYERYPALSATTALATTTESSTTTSFGLRSTTFTAPSASSLSIYEWPTVAGTGVWSVSLASASNQGGNLGSGIAGLGPN